MSRDHSQYHKRNRKLVGIVIILLIAIVHIIGVRNYLSGDLHVLYSSYASDLMMPFGMYFLLCISELTITVFRKWYIKAGLILGTTVLLETLQLFGIYALGSTFDPMDLLAYVMSMLITVFFDKVLFKHLIPYWEL